MSQEWKLPNTRFHKIMNLFSLLLLLGMFLYTAIKWPSLPQTIATHFNFMGEADGWGGKGNIWLMPVMRSSALSAFNCNHLFSRYLECSGSGHSL